MCPVEIQRKQNMPPMYVVFNIFSQPGFAVAAEPPLPNLCCEYITGQPD